MQVLAKESLHQSIKLSLVKTFVILFNKRFLYANFIFGVVKHQARDVSDWVSSTSHGYYFYQRYYPYYSIFDDIPYDELNHRKNIYYQERLNRLKHE